MQMELLHKPEPRATEVVLPRVTVLILNYVRWEDTASCVRSFQDCMYGNFEIVLIDNGSPNDSELQLRKLFPGIIFYQTGSNLGYTGGDPNRVLLWTRLWPDPYGMDDEARGVVADSAGNLYVVGEEHIPNLPAVGGKIRLIKYDAAGTLLWSRSCGSGGAGWDSASSVALDSLGRVASPARTTPGETCSS